MRLNSAEKVEVIRMVEGSELGVARMLKEFGVSRSSFYRWYAAYESGGPEALAPTPASERRVWNRIPEFEKQAVVDIALAQPELTPRELAWRITDEKGFFISESSVYRILKAFDLIPSPSYMVMSAADSFKHPTKRIHELWQTDFTYFKVVGWGWYYLLTVLDDFSRYILAWKLCTTMRTTDVTEVIDMAVAATGMERVPIHHRPRLLSDNGPCFISKDFKEYLAAKAMGHTRSAPYHPMTQGKIERYHRSLKNVVTLQNYYSPEELEREVDRFELYYNHERVHESLNNLTPADVYEGRARDIETARERLKRQTERRRRRYNQGKPMHDEELIRPSLFRECLS